MLTEKHLISHDPDDEGVECFLAEHVSITSRIESNSSLDFHDVNPTRDLIPFRTNIITYDYNIGNGENIDFAGDAIDAVLLVTSFFARWINQPINGCINGSYARSVTPYDFIEFNDVPSTNTMKELNVSTASLHAEVKGVENVIEHGHRGSAGMKPPMDYSVTEPTCTHKKSREPNALHPLRPRGSNNSHGNAVISTIQTHTDVPIDTRDDCNEQCSNMLVSTTEERVKCMPLITQSMPSSEKPINRVDHCQGKKLVVFHSRDIHPLLLHSKRWLYRSPPSPETCNSFHMMDAKENKGIVLHTSSKSLSHCPNHWHIPNKNAKSKLIVEPVDNHPNQPRAISTKLKSDESKMQNSKFHGIRERHNSHLISVDNFCNTNLENKRCSMKLYNVDTTKISREPSKVQHESTYHHMISRLPIKNSARERLSKTAAQLYSVMSSKDLSLHATGSSHFKTDSAFILGSRGRQAK